MGLGESSDEWRRGGWAVGEGGGQAGPPARLKRRAFTPSPVAIRSEVSMHSPLGLYFFFLTVLGIELRTCY